MNNDNPASVQEQNAQGDNNASVSGNNGKPEKMFTQEDVNRIVSERLAREREKNAQPAEPEETEREKKLNERETALKAREDAIAARESREKCESYLKELNISKGKHNLFLDNLDTSNFDSFKKLVDVFGEPFKVVTAVTGEKVEHPPANTSTNHDSGKLADIFKPKSSY